MRKETFVEEAFYHVYNRGVEKRTIFMDDADRYRFIHSLYEFNNDNPTVNLGRRTQDRSRAPITEKRHMRKRLVDISCFCLMNNHFHLIMRQIIKNGIPKFMHKLGTGYANYFNKRYERTGSLFQGRFRAKYIDSNAYLMHLSRYIHLNPLKILEPNWKFNGIRNPFKAREFLKSYRWSSYLDYVGIKNFPSLINYKLQDYQESYNHYEQFVLDYVGDDLFVIKDFVSLEPR